MSLYIYLYLSVSDIFNKELAHMINKAGKSKIYRVDWQAGDPKESVIQFKSWRQSFIEAARASVADKV